MDPLAFIQIRQVRKTYQMGTQIVRALDGTDLDIAGGSFSIIMGPSGSGKSTLLYLVGGLDRATSGSIRVNDEILESLDENALAVYRRRSVGFIFQSFNLVSSMRAQENVEFPMRFSRVPARGRKQRALELLQQVGLEDRANHKPTELSGGQQQRVAIARALVNDPPLILADEPTGNLDTASGMGIMHLLADLHHSGHTIVVVTHDSRMMHFATHVFYLLDGISVSEERYNAAIDAASIE